MASRPVSVLPSAMLTRWRRRRLCTLERANAPALAVMLRSIDGSGARLDCRSTPAAGEEVIVRHPEAGRIAARVTAVLDGEVRLAFRGDAASVAFALAVIVADMSSPS